MFREPSGQGIKVLLGSVVNRRGVALGNSARLMQRKIGHSVRLTETGTAVPLGGALVRPE